MMNESDDAVPDGDYDVVVVDAEIDEDGAARVSLVIVAGALKGRVVPLRGQPQQDPLDMLGTPGTLTVRHGTPSLRLE